ncbi:hypothetical protein [Ornithinimicrobium kibberense]|uniref:hypothetical protein n=1 Tax=Ornithinimicrobium kibberense TaxID=282060 RepID=UPI003619F6B3
MVGTLLGPARAVAGSPRAPLHGPGHGPRRRARARRCPGGGAVPGVPVRAAGLRPGGGRPGRPAAAARARG